MKVIESLLNQVSIINKKNLEILDATGGRFNIFRLCRVNHYENTHSTIIAEFINPNGSHGLKSKLLECLINSLGGNFKITDFNFNKAIIRTEYSTSEGRLDILIEDNQNKAIIIENKIYAPDAINQLKRYDKYAQETYKKGYQIFYLTLFGDKASEKSGGGIEYLPISYKEDIINWLEKCVSISARFPIVRETIIQYINHIKQLTNQDMDTKNKDEIVEILSNIDNLKAAKVINQNYSETFNFLANKYFNSKMKDFAANNNIEYHYEESLEQCLCFKLTVPKWNKECWIGFTFDPKNQCYYGIRNNPKDNRICDEVRKKIHENLNQVGVSNRKESDWWPFYSNIENLSLEIWESDIINSDKFLNDCQSKIIQIISATKNLNLQHQ
jgi:PD-(D/E)XK nuclease superfamily